MRAQRASANRPSGAAHVRAPPCTPGPATEKFFSARAVAPDDRRTDALDHQGAWRDTWCDDPRSGARSGRRPLGAALRLRTPQQVSRSR